MLNELIRLAQLGGSIDTQCQLAGNWHLDHRQAVPGTALVHIITAGTAYLDDQPLPAGTVLFSQGPHQLYGQAPAARRPPFSPLHSHSVAGFHHKTSPGRGPRSQIFCAHFHFDPRALLLQALPERLLLPGDEPRLALLIQLLRQEEQQPQETSPSVIDALAQLLFIEILRGHLASAAPTAGVLRGWSQRHLQKILSEILRQPEREWSVGLMGTVAGLTPASVNRLFRDHLHSSPHAYLQRLRLQQGAYLLRRSSETILGIALRCGFKSDSHFGRLFKKVYGLTPASYRRSA